MKLASYLPAQSRDAGCVNYLQAYREGELEAG